MSSPAIVPALSKPKPYRRYLNSVLHSRFVYATLLAFLNGLIISFPTGDDYFWSWFPFGLAGLKAAAFTMCSLLIFILQISSLTVGRRTIPSSFAVLRRAVFDPSTISTILWYFVSAWWFCQVLIFAVPAHKQLGWVIKGDMASPDRLNERPMYLRWFFSVLAVVQAIFHLATSQSTMHIPVTRPATPQANDHRTHAIESVTIQASRKAPYMIKNALLCSGITSLIAPLLYRHFARGFYWKIHLSIAKLFSNISRSDAHPPDTYFIGTILLTAFIYGALLSLTWETSTYSLLAYMKQEPVKNGYPLSSASQDPDGTLLNGLSSKLDLVKTFAFWELAIISQRYPDRRKAMFADFERPNGPMWSLMHRAALGAITSIDARILGSSPLPPEPTHQPQINTLPKLISTTNGESVVAPVPPPSSGTQRVVDFLTSDTAKLLGQSKDPWHPPIEKSTQEAIEYTKTMVQEHKGFFMQLWGLIPYSLKGFFHTRASTQINSLVLGMPIGNAAIIVDAVDSVTKMLIASLNEDGYGKVVQTVPDTVKQFTQTIRLIKRCIETNMQDVTLDDEVELDEVVIVVERLKAGLRELLSAFQVFLNDAGLSIKDLNEALKASEDESILPERRQQIQPQQPRTQEAAEKPKRRELGSDTRQRAPVENQRKKRVEAQHSRRSESGLRRQQNGDGNVFGARDFNSEPGRRREMQQVR